MTSGNPTVFRALVVSCFAIAMLSMQTTASADVSIEALEIQYTGLDISYDGNSISTPGNSDPLESVDFIVDGTKLLGLNAPGDTPLEIALSIPNLTNIPTGGGTVTSDTGGSLDLTLPSGKSLNLTLGEVSVTYVALDSFDIYFLLGGGSAEVLGQMLPIPGAFENVVAISFSTNIKTDTMTKSGGFVTAFEANGTGAIQGGYVPEPGSITLLLCGLASFICWRRRK